MSADLISYYQHKVQELFNKVVAQDEKIEELTTIIFELLREECPEEYRVAVREKVFKKFV
jgi:hypothetical protein